MTTPYVLIVLDGWGHRDDPEDNAIAMANTPAWDNLWQQRPHCLISASGPDVGLPGGQMGNSETGHMNLGTGRVVDQNLMRINRAIDDGTFYKNPTLLELMHSLADNGKSLHILGLLSPGGVHSHENQIKAAVTLAFDQGVANVYVHAFLDGRDVPPRSAQASLSALTDYISQRGAGGIASITGRFYAMDRDQRWERTQKAYRLITQGKAEFNSNDSLSGLQQAYRRGESDEFVNPTAIRINGELITTGDGDGVLFMNFRSDRARQLTRSFADSHFDHFDRSVLPVLTSLVSLTQYADDLDIPCAFAPLVLDNGLGEFISNLGKTQLRLAETEKYAHVTFFFSGGRETPFPGEERELVPSPKVATYDLQPAMSAPEVTERLIKAILDQQYDLIVCNYANCDMVGHTGNMDASISAVECIDQCLAQVIEALTQVNGHCLITADHGNVEQMSDNTTGQAHTAHTSELIPLVYIGSRELAFHTAIGSLRDVAPTLLYLMNITPPVEMTGKSLLTDHC